ncbi:hypothetical protein CG006_01795 [Mesoplasma florum]|uniref:hypothetical protein n=1 Tax=Mesoplasma florum TaxID=2151 RepID=UPI000D04767C|nr:hypothetical protein [Mesoplasma florum]AVN63710.1 hypothetical protein CG006_01795 [Mesoplasma florum]
MRSNLLEWNIISPTINNFQYRSLSDGQSVGKHPFLVLEFNQEKDTALIIPFTSFKEKYAIDKIYCLCSEKTTFSKKLVIQNKYKILLYKMFKNKSLEKKSLLKIYQWYSVNGFKEIYNQNFSLNCVELNDVEILEIKEILSHSSMCLKLYETKGVFEMKS